MKNYLEKDQIASITISKDSNGNQTVALITTTKNETFKLKLGNVDCFLENLEKYQIE